MKNGHIAYKRSMVHFAVMIIAALCGLALGWPVKSLGSYERFGFAFAIGIFLPLIVFWIGDLIPEWHFRIAERAGSSFSDRTSGKRSGDKAGYCCQRNIKLAPALPVKGESHVLLRGFVFARRLFRPQHTRNGRGH